MYDLSKLEKFWQHLIWTPWNLIFLVKICRLKFLQNTVYVKVMRGWSFNCDLDVKIYPKALQNRLEYFGYPLHPPALCRLLCETPCIFRLHPYPYLFGTFWVSGCLILKPNVLKVAKTDWKCVSSLPATRRNYPYYVQI